MDRSDRNGLALALVGHALLFAALTIGIAHRPPPPSVQAPAMDVQLVDATGLQSAAPEPATEAPQEQVAPESGAPDEAAPPAPEPEPVPTPPRAEPTPAPPRPQPAPKAEARPVPKPQAAPAPSPKPAPKPEPAPAPAPSPKPAKEARPARPAASLGSDLMKDLKAAARSEGKGSSEGKGQRTAASRIGPDFLKGIVGASAGKGKSARAALTGAQMNGLAAAIKRQVQPCYDLGALGGTPAMQIVTVLQLRFNKDGSIQGTPQLVEQKGVGGDNRSYARQMEDVSRRAVLRCSPLKLPPELYEGGWENITMGFIPGQMQ